MFGLTVEEELHLLDLLAYFIIFLSLPIFLTLTYVIPAPWGKTSQRRYNLGPCIPARIAWFVFESPNLVWSYVCWKSETPRINKLLLLLFVLHYLQRAILYPLRMSPSSKQMPLAVVASAFSFCSFNGYLQVQSLSLSTGTAQKPHFVVVGVLVFLAGALVNLQSDAILRKLASSYGTYQIPRGGFFEFVSCPHFTGEILEWTGFWIASGSSLAAGSFVIFTAANLLPRGRAHHEWYQYAFENYPVNRKAVLPYLY
jgi:hypothetical protein